MGSAANEKASRWLKAFYGSGGPGSKTKAFDEWPVEVRSRLKALAELQDDEFPVLAHVAGPDDWTLLTTTRLLIAQNAELRAIAVGDVRNAEADFREFLRTSRQKVEPPRRAKHEVDKLRIYTVEGEVILRLEAGRPLIAFARVLTLIGASNKLALLRAQRERGLES